MAQQKYRPPVGSVVLDPDDLSDEPVTVSADDLSDGPQPAGPTKTHRVTRGMFGDFGDMALNLLQGVRETVLPTDRLSDVVEGPMQALRDPRLAAELLWEAMSGATADQWAKTKASAGRVMSEPSLSDKAMAASETLGHGLATVLPIVGPAAANTGETIASGETARGIGQGMGLLAPNAVARGVRVPAGVEAVRGAIGKAAARLDRGVTRRMVDVMAPKTGPNKTVFGNQAAKVSARIAREPDMGAVSAGGLQSKIEARLSDARAALDEVADARSSARTYGTKPVVDALKAERQKLVSERVEASRPLPEVTSPGVSMPPGRMPRDIQSGRMTKPPTREAVPIGDDVVPAENRPAYARLTRAINEIEQLGPVARYEALRRIRAAWDEGAKAEYAPAIAPDYLKSRGQGRASATAAGTLREFLAKHEPATAAANADFHLYKTAADVMRAAEEAERVRPNMFRKTMGRVTGAATGGATGGGVGAVAGVLAADVVDAIARSGVTTKIATARLMARLADALRAGNPQQVNQLLAQIKRTARVSVAFGRVRTGAKGVGEPLPAR